MYVASPFPVDRSDDEEETALNISQEQKDETSVRQRRRSRHSSASNQESTRGINRLQQTARDFLAEYSVFCFLHFEIHLQLNFDILLVCYLLIILKHGYCRFYFFLYFLYLSLF